MEIGGGFGTTGSFKIRYANGAQDTKLQNGAMGCKIIFSSLSLRRWISGLFPDIANVLYKLSDVVWAHWLPKRIVTIKRVHFSLYGSTATPQGIGDNHVEQSPTLTSYIILHWTRGGQLTNVFAA